MKTGKVRLRGMQSTNTNTVTRNEKKAERGASYAKSKNEILKPEMPEILKLTFWRRSSRMSFS